MTGALASLVDAVRDRTTLAWCIEHAPTGDADRVIRELWDSADASTDGVLVFALAWRAWTNAGSPQNEARLALSIAYYQIKETGRAPLGIIQASCPIPTLVDLAGQNAGSRT
jgi:hypothetical protein